MGLMDKVNENVKKGMDAVDKVKENENIKKSVAFVDKKIEDEKQKRDDKKQIVLKEKQKKEVKKSFFKAKQKEYSSDAKLADKVYKAYITDGLSRLDKVNGRFLASQTIKMDVLIEQNNEIIRLLRNLAGEEIELVCKECDTILTPGTKFCPNCGNGL